MAVGWKPRIVVTVVAVSAWTLFIDAVYEHRWPGTNMLWWAAFVAWFGGWGLVWLLVESLVRARRARPEP